MVRQSPIDHDGGMNDTQETPRPADPGDDFDPQRLRTIMDMKRSSDDRLLAGVCAGAAKYLNIDPVIVRVIIAVLTFVGGAGVILYAAAWLLLPSEDAEKSLVAEWFKLDKNEEQVRTIGLVGAGAVAVISAVGSHGHIWWGFPGFIIPLALLYFVFVVRPNRRRRDDSDPAAFAATAATSSELGDQISEDVTAKIDRKVAERVKRAREPKSKALVLLTLSFIAIGVAITRIIADLNDGAPWTTYVAVALGITAIGLIVGTLYGYGGPLIALGIVLGLVLAFGSVLPSPKIGDQSVAPLTATQVDGTYKHGIGLLKLDLSLVAEPDQLLGRTITLKAGVGQTKVIVPAGVNVVVISHLKAGEIDVFDREVDGTDNELSYPSDKPGPALIIKIDQRVGNVEVVRS
jgi:phage shock protein PspC (stress-responsive transcriptional regulator)